MLAPHGCCWHRARAARLPGLVLRIVLTALSAEKRQRQTRPLESPVVAFLTAGAAREARVYGSSSGPGMPMLTNVER